MALGAGDLVLCSGTLPRDVSFRARVEAASAGGFAGISLWGRDYRRAHNEGLNDADMRALLADHSLEIAELDPAWWWLPGASATGRSFPTALDTEEVFAFGEDELFAVADAVGARSINAVDVLGGDWDVDAAAEAFAGLCDRAAEHGLLVHLEFLPWSKIPDLGAAWDVVRGAGRANGGIAVDAWHFFRAGGDQDALRAVPGDRVLGVQIDDGPAAAEPNLIEATLHERLLPGDGEFDLTGLLRTLAAIGCPAPIGVEVFSDDLHALEPTEAARRTGDATRAVLRSARARER
jgi:sugar phosphate isomerase/epimerase